MRGVINSDLLEQIRIRLDGLWQTATAVIYRHQLLAEPVFSRLIEHSPLLNRHQAIFGAQTQLLQVDAIRQDRNSATAERYWHRDLVFPGHRPLAVNTLLYLDHMVEERGPTRVLGEH